MGRNDWAVVGREKFVKYRDRGGGSEQLVRICGGGLGGSLEHIHPS